MFSAPQTPIDLIKNIKLALDQNYFLLSTTYSDASLLNIFGGSTVRWLTQTNEVKSVEISDFGKMSPSYLHQGNILPSLSIAISRKRLSDARFHASFDLQFTSSIDELKFSRVTAIFGNNWSDNPYFPPPTGRIIKPSTAPHGNDRIKYALSSEKYTATVSIDFHHDGTLSTISAQIDE